MLTTDRQLPTSVDDRHQRPLRLLEPLSDRQTLITKIITERGSRPASILICGPKGSGKSTFGRMLVNAMITRTATHVATASIIRTDGVAYLDLDPGQPEFSPPGELSLIHMRTCNFGPPFTHPSLGVENGNRLIRAHHYGGLSPKNDPEVYISCAKDLLSHYQGLLLRCPSCPLVVNCAGWIQGTGLEILVDLIRLSRVSKIVYTSTHGPREVVDSLTEAAEKVCTPLHFLTSQGSEVAMRAAADLRMMQTLSYFHLDEPEAGNLRWYSNPISEQVPLVVHWSGEKQAIFAVMVLSSELDPEAMAIILNGCTVGLVVVEEDEAIPDDGKPVTTVGRQADQGRNDVNVVIDRPQHAESASVSDSDLENWTEPELSRDRSTHVKRNPSYGGGQCPQHLEHSSIARNSVDIPYISVGKRFASPLNPSNSYSVGQALVRGIDLENKCFQLLTPVPPTTLTALHQRKAKIVMVRGSLDTPTWAFREDWECGASIRRRIRLQDPNAADRFDAQDSREWADRTPYVSVREDKVQSVSAKVWRVRRDLKPRASGDDTD